VEGEVYRMHRTFSRHLRFSWREMLKAALGPAGV